MSRSYRSCAVAGIVALTATLLPLTATPATAATEVVAAPLPAPTGLAPADNRDFPQTVRKDIVFSWNAVAGATGYRVQFGRDDTWSDDPIASFDVKGTALAVPQGNAYQTYTWRVAALKGSTLGHWTSEETNSQREVQFTKGWRQFPADLASSFDGGVAPSLSWTAVPSASSYRLVVSPAPISGLIGDTPPEGGAICVTTRNRLTPVLDGGEYAEGAGAGAEACKLTLTAATLYYWRVQAVDEAADTTGAQEKSLVSVQETFVTPAAATEVNTPLPGPVLTSLETDPDSLCEITNAAPERALCNDAPTIRWSAVPGATHYKVWLSPDDLFQSVVDVVKTEGTQWTPQRAWGDMSPSMAMYYDVEACNDRDASPTVETIVCETLVPAGEAPSFRKVSPRPSGLSTPTPSGRLAFSWTSYAEALAAAAKPTAVPVEIASQDAKGYRVQVAASEHPSYDATVIDAVVDGPVTDPGRFTSAGGTTFIPTQPLADGNYLWRVQAIDSAGNKLPWSFSKAFTRDSTPPRLVSVTPGSKVSTTGALKLTFSEPVTGLSSSSVWLSPAASTTLTVTGPRTATLTPTRPLLPGATYGLRVGAPVQDAVGNAAVFGGPNVTVNPLADDNNAAISYSSGWGVLSSTNAVGGRFHVAAPTARTRQSASMVFRGTGVVLTACLGPTNGYIDTYIDGVRRGRTNLYRSYSGCNVKVFGVSRLARGQHTVKVVATNLRSASSRGTKVTLDAFTVTP